MKIPLLRTLLVIFLSSMLDICHADHITVQGEVSGQWSADTVFVAGDLTIADGDVLLISSGTVVTFLGTYTVHVQGSVQAGGNVHDSISFYRADTTGFYVDTIPDGGWRGIRFDHNRLSNQPSFFNYCRFSYAKRMDTDLIEGNGGAIYVNDYDKVTIEHCLFADNFATYNGGAVYLDSANVIIHNSTFLRNRCGPPILPYGYGGAVCSDNSNPEIRWNVFTENSSTGVGGGLSVRYKDCNIYHNIFTANTSGLGGALCMGHIPETVHRVNNNLMAGNSAEFFGGGVATLEANPVYINNTIVNNTAVYGGGFYCKDSISPDFYNTIFWGNQAGVGNTGYLFESFSQADFFNCDVEYGPAAFGGGGGGIAFAGAYERCIELDPEFTGFSEFPFQPDPGSPCIDAGTPDTIGFFLPEYDLAHLPRFWGGTIDMGAYELFSDGLYETENKLFIRVFPNPFLDHFTIEIDSPEGEDVLIEVFDIAGRIIKRVETFCPIAGMQQITFDLSGFQIERELLLLKVTYSQGQYCRKIIQGVTQRATE